MRVIIDIYPVITKFIDLILQIRVRDQTLRRLYRSARLRFHRYHQSCPRPCHGLGRLMMPRLRRSFASRRQHGLVYSSRPVLRASFCDSNCQELSFLASIDVCYLDQEINRHGLNVRHELRWRFVLTMALLRLVRTMNVLCH